MLKEIFYDNWKFRNVQGFEWETTHTNSFNTRQSLQRATFEAEILQITYTFFVFTKSWPTSAL